MVNINWYNLVRYVAKTTMVPFMLVMETLVVMGDLIIITPSIVYVVHCMMIIPGNVVVVKSWQWLRNAVEVLSQVVCTFMTTLGRSVVEIIMFLCQAYVVNQIQDIGRYVLKLLRISLAGILVNPRFCCFQFDSTKHHRFSRATLVSSCSNTAPVRDNSFWAKETAVED